jgi:hypothetical protein
MGLAVTTDLASQSRGGLQSGLFNIDVANIPYQSGLVIIPRLSEAKMVSTLDGMTTVHYRGKSNYTVGNPYLYESFLPGRMELKEGSVLENLPVRYNIARDIMEFVYVRDTLDIINPLSVENIQFAGKEFIYSVGMSGDDRVEGNYFEVLYDSDGLKLLLQHEARLERDEYLRNYAGGFGSGDLYYEKEEHYFILTKHGSAIPVRTRRDIIRLFPDYRKEISAFWKQENLRFRNREDLLKVSDFIAERSN